MCDSANNGASDSANVSDILTVIVVVMVLVIVLLVNFDSTSKSANNVANKEGRH